jgi:hypothetical protein
MAPEMIRGLRRRIQGIARVVQIGGARSDVFLGAQGLLDRSRTVERGTARKRPQKNKEMTQQLNHCGFVSR